MLSGIGYMLWPGLTIPTAFALGLIEHTWELSYLFSGVMPIVMLPPYLAFGLSDPVYSVCSVLLWALAWLIPTYFFARRPRSGSLQAIYLSLMSLFALGQSFLGLLMLAGKHV